jgi:hypothetical protein
MRLLSPGNLPNIYDSEFGGIFACILPPKYVIFKCTLKFKLQMTSTGNQRTTTLIKCMEFTRVGAALVGTEASL